MDYIAHQATRYQSSPGKNTGLVHHALFQRIFLTQESNLGLLHCRQILYQLSYEGNLVEVTKFQPSYLKS